MKYNFITIFIFFHVLGVYSQEPSEIEKKYDFVEVWGLENQSRKDFLTEIMSYPEGICQQSLSKMGIPDGNKLPIAFSNKIIVTTRPIPKFELKSKMDRPTDAEIKKWEEFKEQFDKLGFYERQQITYFIPLFEEGNNEGVDSLYQKLQKELRGYGKELKKEEITRAFEAYKIYSDRFSKQDVLSVLYHSHEYDSLNEAAIFIAPKYLKNKNDLLEFLPLLLEKGSGVQPILSSFINNFKEKIDWDKHIDLLEKLVNNPNPFQSILVLRIIDKTGFTIEDMELLTSKKMLTMEDILRSKNMPKEYVDYLLIFLNKYSGFAIEQDKEFWIKRLI